ncbi:hypothetical protein Tco_0875098 [Tanacetum coccineum]|uniref:Uncharacterized protein n=1 Tax=Tanacetum coccineum TaxID=301880 RepID=A0ABQ5BRI2_9ASTR
MLGPLMKDWVLHNADGALVVDEDFGIHEVESIIQQLVLNPEYLCTAAIASRNIPRLSVEKIADNVLQALGA